MSAKSKIGHRPGETPKGNEGLHKLTFKDGATRFVAGRQRARCKGMAKPDWIDPASVEA